MSKTIEDLRATLFSALEGVKNGTLDLERAKAVNEIGKTIVESAKVEVDFLRVTDGQDSRFISGPEKPKLEGAPGVTQHRIR